MDYKARVDKVIDYIGKHLDEELDLDELCKIACFSKYHFHRLFTIYSGVSLSAYIKWLRLKRAAHQLVVQKEKTIINIALDAGFESHESFSRAFKQTCGLSPSAFRAQANWSTWEKPPYALNITGKKMMTITIKDMPSKKMAVMEHRGDPAKLPITFEKLASWAKEKHIDLKANETFAFGYNDPREVPPEEFRFDVAVGIPENLKLGDQVIEKVMPKGRYATTMHKGSLDNIGDTIYEVSRDWLSDSGEELGDFPCIFCYHNFDHEVAETELLTEIWILLK